MRHAVMVMQNLKFCLPPTSEIAIRLGTSIPVLERVATFVSNIEDAVQSERQPPE
jgi:hypothetical protein